MQYNFLNELDGYVDYSRSRVRVPLSGGINSAALLCVLGEDHPEELKPKELHLYYAHFLQHSPDTYQFVIDCFLYTVKKFKRVNMFVTNNNVNQFFIDEKMIPHPTISPCSRKLKIEPMQEYDQFYKIDHTLIGYVQEDFSRYERAIKKNREQDKYPIIRMNNADCFSIVERVIGWYPAIYKIKQNGKHVFSHNNCLPCKNMTKNQFISVGKYFPQLAQDAADTAAQIPGGYWGRDDVSDIFKCDVCERM